MVVEETQSEAFAPARQLALEIGAIGMGVVLLMSIGIYFASRRIARPILAITDDGNRGDRGRSHPGGAGHITRRDRHARGRVQRHDRPAA